MARLNAYWTIFEAGRRLSRADHERLAYNIGAHVREVARDNGWTSVWPALRGSSHHGDPCLRMEARSAAEARANVREVERFVRLAGYQTRTDMTQAVRRAL